jgi:hypothetical protein
LTHLHFVMATPASESENMIHNSRVSRAGT